MLPGPAALFSLSNGKNQKNIKNLRARQHAVTARYFLQDITDKNAEK